MDFLDDYLKVESGLRIGGLTEELSIFYVLKAFQKTNKHIIVLVSSLYEANKLYQKIKTHTDDVLLFPMDDFVTSVALAVSPELKMTRLETLNSLSAPKIIVTNLMGFLKFLPHIESNKIYTISKGENINRDTLVENLVNLGYTKDSIVTSTGEFAVRGFVVDAFLFSENHPIRIEFFGNEIESIRYFDEKTQRSLETIESINIYPVDEITTSINSSLYDYFDNPLVIRINEQQINASNLKLQSDIVEYCETKDNHMEKYMFYLDEIIEKEVIYLDTLENIDNEVNINLGAKTIIPFDGD